jgi:hypothetical protein
MRYSSVRRASKIRLSTAACLLLGALFVCGAVRAENIEIQGVAAADAGKKEQTIPASLNSLKNILKDSMFGTFKDAGKQTIKVAPGGKSNATIGNYGVEVLLKSGGEKCRLEVTIKDGGKAIGDPICLPLAKGHPRMVAQVGSKEAPTILIFTLKDE